MPCDISCDKCQYIEHCGGEFDNEQNRLCGESCSHFDNINQCCWQAGPWGLEFSVSDGDFCSLGYKEGDGR